MPDRKSKPFAGVLVALLLLSTMIAESRADTWYRVEILVFSNSGGSAAEEWDATPALSYPGKTRLLVDPGHPAAQTASGGYNPVYPAPFIALPASELEFRGAAARMQSSGRYRKLFHEAWTQPIPGRSQAIPIVLDRSGDGGPWPALQGTIKLYIARYIYLETNLWLNTAGEYLHSDWQMPPPPLAPPSLAPEDPLTGTVRNDVPVLPATEPAGPEYPYRHAVLLSQTRRMRSNEINYIDHPMFGLVVKVTPVSMPEAKPADETGPGSSQLTQ